MFPLDEVREHTMPPRKPPKPRTFRNDYRPLAREIEAARNEFDVRKFSKADAEVRRKFRVSVLRLAVALPADILDALSLMKTATSAAHNYVDHMRGGLTAMNTKAQNDALTSSQRHVVALLRILSGASTEDLLEVTGCSKLAKKKRREAKRALANLNGPTTPIEFVKTPNPGTMKQKQRSDPLALSRMLAMDIPITDLRSRAAKDAIAQGLITAEQVRANTAAMRWMKYKRVRERQGDTTSYAR